MDDGVIFQGQVKEKNKEYVESEEELKSPDDAWLFVKIDRNTNITVPTNKGCMASRLTFRSVRTVLPSLV